MPIALAAGQLLSRTIRANILSGKSGPSVLDAVGTIGQLAPRKIDFVNSIQKRKESNKILDLLFDAGKRFVGGWLSGLNFLRVSFTAAFSWLYSGVEALKAFDWNASDAQLQRSQQNLNVQLASLWGGVVGGGLGWLAGIAVGYGVSLICPVIGGAKLAKIVAGAVAIEGLEEFSANLFGVIRQTTKLLAGQALIGVYVNYRNFIKGLPYEWLVRLYGQDTADFIRQVWGEEGQPVYSFNRFVDEQVESIKNPVLQAFVEELLEEAWDSFIESGFIIAQELDAAYEQQKLALSKGTLGTPRTVVVEPDRTNESERFAIQAIPQNLAGPIIQQTLLNYQLMENRDLGQLVGEPVSDYARKQPLGLRCVIKLFSVARPPYASTRDRRITQVTVSIPDLRPGAFDWEQIKLAAGGANGYNWGRFKATCQLSNGRPFICHAASAQEAEQRARAFLALSTAEIETINITEEKRDGKRALNPGLRKESTRIYPGYVTVINRDRQLASDLGKPTKSGRYRDRDARIQLWPQERPFDFEEIRADLLRRGFE